MDGRRNTSNNFKLNTTTMKRTIKFAAFVLVAAFALALAGNSAQAQQKKAEPWPVPAEYKNMANPLAGDAASIKLGKTSYNKNCASCHGKTGLGDGPKGRSLKTFSGDFTGAEYQGQTDGEHFYKTKVGRGDMPAYDKKVPDREIWAIINYMRTFKK
ncbi:Cytochrome C oxidase, cbb3-type, subunit III [anaerobic digester metagenome]